MAYVDVQVEYDIDEAFDELTEEEQWQFVRGWAEVFKIIPEEPSVANLENPVLLLEIITELRRKGYTVEP